MEFADMLATYLILSGLGNRILYLYVFICRFFWCRPSAHTFPVLQKQSSSYCSFVLAPAISTKQEYKNAKSATTIAIGMATYHEYFMHPIIFRIYESIRQKALGSEVALLRGRGLHISILYSVTLYCNFE